MGTYTAQILIGNSHTFHDGILPTHQMFLSENSRAAWILKRMPMIDEEVQKDNVWIPNRPSTIFRDGMMMIAYHIIKDENFRKEAKRVFGEKGDAEFLDICEEYDNEKLIDLFEHCKTIKSWPKLVITILDGSYLENSKLSELKIQNISELESCFSENIITLKKEI